MKTTDFKKQVAHVLCSFKIYICMSSEQTNHSKKWHLAVNFYSLKAQAAVMHTAAFVGKINDT